MALYYELQGIGNQMGMESVTLTFAIWDDGAGAVPDLADVRVWWAANAPASFGVVLAKETTEVVDKSPRDYVGTATYKKWVEPSLGGDEWSYEITTQDAVVTHSMSTVSAYRAGGGTPPNYRQAINVTRDGVQGQAIPRPTASIVKTYYLDPSAFTLSYRAAISKAVGKMNSASFAGYSAHEVLFAGVSGSQRGRDNVQLTCRFDISENRTGLAVGPVTGITKAGWDLLWVLYRDSLDTLSSKTLKIPHAAYVERVFGEMDFASVLGL